MNAPAGKLIVGDQRVSEFPMPVVASESVMLMQAIVARSADPSFDIDKMKALMQMHREINAQKALEAFGAAMSAAQAEMGPISVDAFNPQTKSKYASYAQLDRALRPIYTKHGFALSFNEGDTDKPNTVRMLCKVTHSAGHVEPYKKDMDASGKGAKGGDVMTVNHAIGAAQAYAMRYILKAVFNVSTGEEDKDGNDPEPTIGPGQLASLEQLIAEVKADVPKLCRMLKVNKLSDIRVGAFETVKAIIEAKRPK